MPNVKFKMQSLISRGKSLLTPNASSTTLDSNGFSRAKTETDLFPATDPAVDGDKCLHDCSSCSVHLPAKFSIDESDHLYGHVNGWDSHLIVGTGKTDWVRDVTDIKGSVMHAVGKYGQEIQMSEGRGKGKVMLSASNMPTGGDHGDCDDENGADCLLLPAWTMIDKVKPEEVPDLMKDVISQAVTNKSRMESRKLYIESNGLVSEPEAMDADEGNLPTQPQAATIQKGNSTSEDATEPDISSLAISSPSSMPKFGSRIQPIPHAALILMCSHKTRDARCGQSAPLLRKEFERHLRPLGLYRDLHDTRPGGVGVYFINHVGGHKYSANVMIYRRQGSTLPEAQKKDQERNGQLSDAKKSPCNLEDLHSEAIQGIWLARVKPEDCENIVRYTVLQGKLVKPNKQLRAGFDRGRGLISW